MSQNNLDEDVMSLVKKLNKLLLDDFNKRLNEYDLTCQQGRIIFYLNKKVNIEHQTIHQNDIEKHFDLSKSTVSGLMKRLEKKGLIEKEVTAPYYSWKPTEKAVSIVNHIHGNRNKTIEKLTSGFTEQERENLVNNIKKLISNMEKEESYVEEN